MAIHIPPDIQAILGQPGRCWTDKEVFQVKVWLNEEPQYNQMIEYTQQYLGREATREDAEEVWQDFCLGQTGSSSLDYYIRRFEPGKGRTFLNWAIHLCFRQDCVKKGNKIRERLESIESIFSVKNNERGAQAELIELEANKQAVNPAEQLEREEFLKALNRCLFSLRPQHRATFVLREIEELSVKETADQLGVPQGSVKGRLNRAKHELKKCLKKEGWAS
jgi:RNA polymerase sigma factor (sigma-70 family)